MEYTNQQKEAITHIPGKGNVIISAAAGSGKTAVVIEHIKELIKKGIPSEKIAAITFTEKAAAEIEERLLLENTSNDNILVGTISSFCRGLLSEYAEKVGYKGDFSIIDESTSLELEKKALTIVFDKFYEDKIYTPEEREIIFTQTDDFSDKNAKEIVKEMKKAIDKTINKTLPMPTEKTVKKEFLFLFYEKYREVVCNINHALKILENYPKGTAYKNTISDKNIAEALYNAVQKDDIELINSALKTDHIYKNFTLGKIINSDKENAKILKNLYKLWNDNGIKVLKKIISCYKEFFDISKKNEYIKALDIFRRLSIDFKNNYSELKKEYGVCDFSDLELLLLEILNENPDICEEIAGRFEEIIVDEFQDSNEIQYSIFKKISNPDGNLLFVGDLKQSIYMFRGADSSIFSKLASCEDNFKTIYLTQNFRSTELITRAVNDVFEGNMTKERGGTDYLEQEKLNAREPFSGDLNAYITEFVITTEKKDDKAENDLSLSEEKQDAECIYIAKRILELVNSEFFLPCEKRAIKFSDIAIISSSLKGTEKYFTSALSLYEIPFARSERSFFSLSEISAAIDFLYIIDNPYLDFSLISVFFSKMYGGSGFEIANLYEEFLSLPNENSKKHLSLYEKFTEASPERFPICRKIANDISEIRSEYANIGAKKTIEKVLDFTSERFLRLISSSENPENALKNLRLLKSQAMEFFQQSNRNISATIFSFLEKISGETEKVFKEPASSGNKVKILTIHESKGLEFPVVFLAFAGKKFNIQETQKDYIFDQKLGYCRRFFEEEIKVDTFPYIAAKNRLNIASKNEELRKLYVALTRAKSKLIITSKPTKTFETGYEETLSGWNFNYFSDIILNSHAINRGSIRIIEQEIELENKLIHIEKHSQKTLKNYHIIEKDENPELVYPREILTSTPRKLAATELGVLRNTLNNKIGEEPLIFPKLPEFLISTSKKKKKKKKKISAKKRGDAFHLAMQIIDFAIIEDKNSYSQLLPAKAQFAAEEWDSLDFSALDSFFASKLGKRATKAAKENCLFKEYQLYTAALPSEFSSETNWEFSEVPLIQGICDLFFYENKEIVIVDYKSNTGWTPCRLIEEYHGQLEIYKRAIEEMTETKVSECWLYSFELGEILII